MPSVKIVKGSEVQLVKVSTEGASTSQRISISIDFTSSNGSSGNVSWSWSSTTLTVTHNIGTAPLFYAMEDSNGTGYLPVSIQTVSGGNSSVIIFNALPSGTHKLRISTG